MTVPNESILFIHGIGASSWMWWQQLPAFSDYHTIAVDLPGHGKNAQIPWKSLAATTQWIAEEIIQKRKVHVVGISLGGHVALELAKNYPDNILSVVISGITVRPMRFRSLLKIQAWLIERGQNNTSRLHKLAKNYYGLPDDKIDEFITNYRLLTRTTYETIGKEISNFSLDETYGNIRCPLLVVAGAEESKEIKDSVEILPQIIKSAQGLIIPKAKHSWPIQLPHQFNNLLKEWLLQHKDDF